MATLSNRDVLLLGVDVGTQGAKAALVTPDGELLGQGYRSYRVTQPKAGFAEQFPEADWWVGCRDAIAAALDNASARPSQVVAMGCSAQSPNVVLVDTAGVSLRPAIIWQDMRSAGVATRVDLALRRSGIWSARHPPLTAQSFASSLLWLRENEPELFRQAHLKLTTLGYLLYRLTGKHVIDRATASGMMPFYALDQGQWDPKVCSLLSIDTQELPAVVSSHTVVGSLLAKAAAELGLPPDVPVVAGTGDTMADLVGAGVVRAGQTAFTYGTIFTIMQCLSSPIPDAFCFAHSIDGIYLLVGGVPLAGASLRWFVNEFAQGERDLAAERGESIYALLCELGTQIPAGSGGLLALPCFGHPDAETDLPSGAALLGLRLSHTRGHVYRAILEGIAYEVRRQLDRMAQMSSREVLATGGGSQDPLWTQITSDVTGLVQSCSTVPHGAPVGVAYLAGCGVGILDGLDQLTSSWVTRGRRVVPDPKRGGAYEIGYRRYLRARAQLVTTDFP